MEVLRLTQRKVTNLLKELENKTYKRQLRELGLCFLEKRRGDLIALCNSKKQDCSELNTRFFSEVKSDITQGSGLKLQQRRLRLDTGKIFFMETVAKHQNRLLREAVESSSLAKTKRPKRP